MKFIFSPSHCSLGVALHAVVATAESHDNVTKRTEFYYEALEMAFCGGKPEKLIDQIAMIKQSQGYKTLEQAQADSSDPDFDLNSSAYIHPENFIHFAELLYLVTTAYNVVNNMNKLPALDKAAMSDLVKQSAAKAAESLMDATRALHEDFADYEQMPSMTEGETPLPYLRPILNMLYNTADRSTQHQLSTAFGTSAAENLTAFVQDSTMQILKCCEDFNSAPVQYFY